MDYLSRIRALNSTNKVTVHARSQRQLSLRRSRTESNRSLSQTMRNRPKTPSSGPRRVVQTNIYAPLPPQRREGRPSISGRSDDLEMKVYDWPDLPQITSLKDAIARNTVSEGVSYSLPVDKGKNAQQMVYQTNLRTMFQEPYRTEPKGYDEKHVLSSARHHLNMRSAPSLVKRNTLDVNSIEINQESEGVRQLYARSAPSRGLTGRTTRAEDIRTRSRLYLPLKAKVPEEAIRLKKEAEKIIRSVHEQDKDSSREGDNRSVDAKPGPGARDLGGSSRSADCERPSAPRVFHKRTAEFANYKEFSEKKPPPIPPLPEDLRSPYLSRRHERYIWEWLHHGEVVTEMSHFMALCA